MHDIKLIRECPEIFDKALEKRGEGSKSLQVIALDTKRRKTIEKLEKLLAERKTLSKKFGEAEKNNENETISISDDIKNITDTNKAKILKITGKAGNLLLVNTSLIHRGSPLKSGCRYAMTNYFYSKNKLENYKNHFPKRIIEKFY